MLSKVASAALSVMVAACSSSSSSSSNEATPPDATGTFNGVPFAPIVALGTVDQSGDFYVLITTRALTCSDVTADGSPNANSYELELQLPTNPPVVGTTQLGPNSASMYAILTPTASDPTTEGFFVSTSGALTITNVSASVVEGSFDVTFPAQSEGQETHASLGGEVKGTFSAQICS